MKRFRFGRKFFALPGAIAAVLGFLVLGACGGGGSSTAPPAAPPTAPPAPPPSPPPAGTSSSSAVELPFTGQLDCFDSAGASVDCGSTAATVPVGQDGAYASGKPSLSRFTHPAAQPDCMVDALTGLTWSVAADSIGTLSWSEALARANALALCGHDDWRLPNRRELRGLIAYGETSLPDWLVDQRFVGARSGRYWSATSRAGNPAQAWALDLATGRLEGAAKATPLFVWPVRGGIAQ